MAMAPEAQLMPLVELGPVKPNSMAMLQLAAPANTVSASAGSTARGPPSMKLAVLSLPVRDAAERGAHHRANPVGIFPGRVERRVGQGHTGGGDAELREAVEPAGCGALPYGRRARSRRPLPRSGT